MQSIDTVVIGAGQAGLAVSYELGRQGVAHVVLEKERIGAGWANRWDSFCLVTPNWSARLPGFPYDGDEPDGFMLRDEIVAYLERYAASFKSPVMTGARATGVVLGSEGSFEIDLEGSDPFQARNLVVATGAYQKPHRPPGMDEFPSHVRVMDAPEYTNADDLPDGDVLIIGSGQTGCQLSEELFEAGRKVVLACGRAPWFPRRVGGKDVVWWLDQSGFLDADATKMPPEARLFANVLATGHGGGHDLHYRTLRDMGVTLVGRFEGVTNGHARFALNLAECVDWGDARFGQLRDHFQAFANENGLAFPNLPDPKPFEADGIDAVDLENCGAVILTSGFRPDYRSWLPWPEAFDGGGFPVQIDGASTAVPGLYFVGLHFLRKRKSALLCGVGEDAEIVAGSIAVH